MKRTYFTLLLAIPLLSGCAVSAAAQLATAPFRVAAKAVDLATTSQSEADESRGRAMREREERLAKLLRKRDRFARDCPESSTACIRARDMEAEIQEIRGRSL